MTEDRDRAGRTPLHYVVIDDPVGLDYTKALSNPAVAEANFQKATEYKIANTTRLLSGGADVNAQDDQGFTPLHFAAASGTSDEVVQLLLDAGADINARNHNDETPLYLAVANTTAGKLPIVRLLRERDADPTIPAHDGFTALKYVERYGRPELRELFADLL
jgi:ankyrin repeat protein